MSRMGSPSPRSRDLSAVVNVEQPACALVDYPRVPVEHRLQAINAYPCVFHVVSDGPAWLSLMRGQISRWSRGLAGLRDLRVCGLAGDLYGDVLLGGRGGRLFGDGHVHGQDALVVAGFDVIFVGACRQGDRPGE